MTFFFTRDFIFILFVVFSNMRQTIDPSGNFVFYEFFWVVLHVDVVLEVLLSIKLADIYHRNTH